MRKLLIAFTAVIFVLSACKKEGSLEDPNSTPGGGSGGGGGNTGTRLVRTGTRAGNDTITMDYGYNSANRLTSINYIGTLQGQPFTLLQKVNRNSANVITTVVLKSPLFLAIGFDHDSLLTTHTFDAASGRYTSSVSRYIMGGDALADSIVYAYDGSGKMTSQTSYFSDGTTYDPDSKTEYTYAGNNLQSVKSYSFDGSRFVLEATESMEYDSKANPMQMASEAPILGMTEFYSANNVTKRTVVNVDPPETEVNNITYTYNSSNLPQKGVATSGNSSSTTTYYYQ